MIKKTKKKPLKLYSNLSKKRQTKKDAAVRRKAEYLASLPKHPVKRFFYRLHPKRVAAYWFSKRGLFMGLKIVGVTALLVVLLAGGVFAYYRKDIEAIRPGKLAERVKTTVTTYYDRNGEVLWVDRGSGDYRLTVDGENISEYVKQATIAIEDQDFYEHDGISFSGIARSLVSNTQGNSVQGGSTLTQQLVKQVFLAEEAHKRGLDGIPRKIKEAILAIEVERMYTKDQILNLYLNESPYGGPRNGVESAAQTYFGKPAKELNLAESALIAGIPNQPGLYNPYNVAGHEALIARQHRVLDRMVSSSYISKEEADKAKEVAILDTIKPQADQMAGAKAPHFVLMVRSQLEQELGQTIVGRGGLEVTTTLDYRIQKKVEEATKKMFESDLPAYGGFSNSASTVIDTKTGQIVALLGSRDFNYPGFGQDNAATAYIQPGSTIKPLVFAQLLSNQGSENQNFGSGSILSDDRSMDAIYGAPLRNFEGGYRGDLTLRKGLALSRNIPAVKAMYLSGVEPTLNLIREMGDHSYCTQGAETQVGLAASLGGCGVRPVEHTNAIATLARMGVYSPYSAVLEVKNASNDVLKKFEQSSKQVLDPQVAFILNDILSDGNARAELYGPSYYGINVPGVKTAVKTGTSDKDGAAKDIWTVSYSPALTMSTWLGNSDTSILTNGNSAMPAQIIGDVMAYAHTEVYAKEGKWKAGDWYDRPDGIQTIGGEIYPSWYDRSFRQSTTEVTFDRLSKKKATRCTPEDAKIKIDVIESIDPVTKDKRLQVTNGYDPNKEDDRHKCSDRKPTVSVSVSDSGAISVNYTRGTFPLDKVIISINGRTYRELSVRGSGSQTISYSPSGAFTVNARVIDEGYYAGTDSDSWEEDD